MKPETIQALEPEARRLKVLLESYGLEVVKTRNESAPGFSNIGMRPELVLAIALVQDHARRILRNAVQKIQQAVQKST